MYKILVLDSWYSRLAQGRMPGGAEKAAQCVAKSLQRNHDVTLYTPRPSDNSSHIDGIELAWSGVPTRDEWPDEKPATSRAFAKKREIEIEQVTRLGNFDLVINNSSSGSHVAALTRLVQKTGVAAINFCHLSFSVSSFPRLGLITALDKFAKVGGINITPAMGNVKNMIDLAVKRRSIVGDVDENKIFAGSLHPCFFDHVPVYGHEVQQKRQSVFALTRFSKDKNADELLNVLLRLRARGIPVDAHFSSTNSGGLDVRAAAAQLEAAGAHVGIDRPQRESFDLAYRHAAVHLTMSHTTESFGIVPVEMALLGIPTLFAEGSGPQHLCHSVIPTMGKSFSRSVAKKSDDEILAGIEWAKNKPNSYFETGSHYYAEEYSRDEFDARLDRFVEMAMKNSRPITGMDF